LIEEFEEEKPLEENFVRQAQGTRPSTSAQRCACALFIEKVFAS